MARVIRGPSVTLGEEFYPVPPLMEELVIAIEEDPESGKADEDLIKLYADADEAGREWIDDTMRAICGYGIKKLMIQADADEDLFIAMGIDSTLETEDG